jgi:hypothetical protein
VGKGEELTLMGMPPGLEDAIVDGERRRRKGTDPPVGGRGWDLGIRSRVR